MLMLILFRKNKDNPMPKKKSTDKGLNTPIEVSINLNDDEAKQPENFEVGVWVYFSAKFKHTN
jgi:phage antirepressor YoqD-like protein